MDSGMKGPINIGSDLEVNLTDLAQKIISTIGSKSKIVYKDTRNKVRVESGVVYEEY